MKYPLRDWVAVQGSCAPYFNSLLPPLLQQKMPDAALPWV